MIDDPDIRIREFNRLGWEVVVALRLVVRKINRLLKFTKGHQALEGHESKKTREIASQLKVPECEECYAEHLLSELNVEIKEGSMYPLEQIPLKLANALWFIQHERIIRQLSKRLGRMVKKVAD